jgi:single-strand DNA-binding protein
MDLNKVMLIGRVGRDPESKTVGETSLSSFSVATTFKSKEKELTEWHQVTAWGKLGEIAQQILHKGDKVYIEGRISYNTVGEGEAKKTYTQITATNLINLTAKAGSGQASSSGLTQSTTAVADEDIPF